MAEMKLCLGTVQFGMDYGICGQRKPPLADCVRLLDYATQNGITAVDTANAYGTAEEVVGAFLRGNYLPRERLAIISKVRPNLLEGLGEEEYLPCIRANLQETLARLGTDYLDGYLFHSARYVFQPAMRRALLALKKEGLVRRVGVSVYEPEEAREGILCGDLDLLQLPYSVFDQRMEREDIFALAGEKGVELHSRSAFLQGLILLREDQVPPFLEHARPVVAEIGQLCREEDISPIALALAFVREQGAISHLVFGVDNLEQLREDIRLFREPVARDILAVAAQRFDRLEPGIIMPSLWAKNTQAEAKL